MNHKRSFLQTLLATAGAALCLSTCNQHVHAREPTEVSKTHVGQKGSTLRSRTSLEAPRGAEGIRKRLAAGKGMEPNKQNGSQVAVNRVRAATATCKRRSWGGDGSTPASDVCRVGEGWSDFDKYQSPGQGGDEEKEGRRSGTPSGGRAGDDEHIFSDPSPSPLHERAQGKGFQDSPPPDGTADSTRTPVAGTRDRVSSAEAGKINSAQPEPAAGREHDPWEGYQVVAQADAVASWEILREVGLIHKLCQ